jgi:hypothetical protein
MGRIYYSRKTTVEEAKDIDVFWLNEHGYFCGLKKGGIKWTRGWNRAESDVGFTVDIFSDIPYIRFCYDVHKEDGTKESFDYKIALTTTQCNYGGKRYWFVCGITIDGKVCGKRVAKLYFADYKYFGCRTCFNLSYESSNRAHRGYFGFMSKVFDYEKRLEKLNGSMKFAYRKGMPTKKFQKILALHNKLSPEDLRNAKQDLMRRLGSK